MKSCTTGPFVTIIIALILCTNTYSVASDSTCSHTGTDGDILVVDQNHPGADDTNPGTEQAPFKTISRAAELAQPGDIVMVHAGVYRERVAPSGGGEEGKPIVYMVAPDAKVYIKGSDVWKPKWESVTGHKEVYLGRYNAKMFGEYNPYKTVLYMRHPQYKEGRLRHRTLGQVFVDGVHMREMQTLEQLYATGGSWMVDNESDAIYVHFLSTDRPLEKRLVELTVRGRIFAPYKRGLNYIHVKGFILEHCANQFCNKFWVKESERPQAGALGCRGGHHWVIENNVIRRAKSIGIDCGSEGPYDADRLNQPQSTKYGHHVIRNNIISDNGAEGIAAYRSPRVKIINNVFERNNNLGFDDYETGAIKTHFFLDGLIEGNLFRDNECFGVWLDNVYAHARVTRNVFINNRSSAVFLEMGGGPALVDNNIIALTRGGSIWNGDGIYSHDASGVVIAHNLFFANAGCSVFNRKVSNRSHAVFPEDIPSWPDKKILSIPKSLGAKPCVTENIKIFNNIFMNIHYTTINMPVSGPMAQNNESDYNLFETSQISYVPFVANTTGGDSFEQILELIENAYETDNVPVKERYIPRPFHFGPLLSLNQWQLLGMDKHSLEPEIKGQGIRSRDLDMSFVIDDTPWILGCKRINGILKDFFGNPMPDNPLPGPFQNLKKGENHFVLWPVGWSRTLLSK